MPDGADSNSSVARRTQWQSDSQIASDTGTADVAYGPPSNDKTVISKRSSSMPVPIASPLRPVDVGRSLVGGMLGHFHLEEFVGGGGMGAVFRATDTMLGRTVAVKVVSNEDADEEMLRRFRNEAQSAARLDHPNIARVYYVGEDSHWNYIVFEFIEGVNVRDLVEHRGGLPVDEAISYTLQVSQALEHAAHRDVVHRDIKPSNILVMPDGRAKLVDMGLARLHQVDAPSQDLTATGVTLGTFDYISPEQARDPRSADVRSDLYSLGCTLYFMLTGMPPFPEGTVLQKLLSHSSDPPPDPRELRADLNDELCSIALRLMAKQPSQRFQSPRELTDALLMLSDHLGLSYDRHVQPRIAAAESGYSRIVSHLPWIIPFILLCVVLFAVEMLLPKAAQISRASLLHDQLEFEGSDANIESSVKRAVVASEGNPAKQRSDVPPLSASELPGPEPGLNDSARTAKTKKSSETGTTNRAGTDVPSSKSPETTSATNDSAKADNPSKTQTPASESITKSVREPTERANGVDGNKTTAGSTSSSGPTTAGSTAIARSLIVAPNASPDEPQVHTSLAAAIRAVHSFPEVDTIELRSDQRLEDPLTIVARDENSELTIKSAEGHTPLIQFRPSSGDMLADYSMFRVIGGKVNFVGIHFRLDLADSLASEWTLFHLKQIKNISFQDCTFTIRNDLQTTASFFYVEGAPISRMMPEGMPSMIGRLYPTIDLASCVVRGQASLVRAVEGLPFRMTWDQGLLATTQPAIVARGLKDASGAQLVELTMRQVTASLERNLCLIEVENNAPIVPSLKLDCTQCVFDIRTDSEPLVEHRGVENVDSLMRNLYTQSGGSNLYSQKLETLWRIQTASGDKRDFGWRPEGDWYQERSSQKYTPWRSPLPDNKPVYAYLASDFLLEVDQSSMAGFDESRLPQPRDPLPEYMMPPDTSNDE
jgi:serine/threonine protein kinase